MVGIDNEEEEIYHLSDEQLKAVEEAQEQYRRGEYVTNEELEKEIEEWLNEQFGLLKLKVDRYQILTYWKKRNKSTVYSNKLNGQFNAAIRSIRKYPLINRRTDIINMHVKIVKHFYIIYEVFKNEIVILRVWDSRQNPQNLKF